MGAGGAGGLHRDDRCSVSSFIETIKYPMCPYIIAASTGNYSDNLVLLLLASQAS